MDTGLKTIRVTNIQAGNYPEWVRSAWLGCELPCIVGVEELLPAIESVAPKRLLEVVEDAAPNEEPGEYKITGFLVRRDVALTILRKKLPAAAVWYCYNDYLQPNSYFAFETKDVEMVEAETAPTQSLR